jgi:ribosomal protein S18 acetylase RimI-like enzyme
MIPDTAAQRMWREASSKEYKIKRISLKNIDSIYELGKQEFAGQLWYTKKFLKETLRHPGYHYGAYAGKKLVGYILSKKFDRPKIWIMSLIVDVEFRKQGIASKLVNKIQTESVSSSPLEFFIMFVDTEPELGPFYEKLGFTFRAEINDWYDINKPGLIYSKIMTRDGDFIIS